MAQHHCLVVHLSAQQFEEGYLYHNAVQAQLMHRLKDQVSAQQFVAYQILLVHLMQESQQELELMIMKDRSAAEEHLTEMLKIPRVLLKGLEPVRFAR